MSKVKESDPINAVICIGELLEGNNKQIKNIGLENRIDMAIYVYASNIWTSTLSSNKLESLNIFTHYLDEFIKRRNINILSSYASLYALEPAFKEEYKKIVQTIETLMKNKSL